jgi:hypothetical protein
MDIIHNNIPATCTLTHLVPILLIEEIEDTLFPSMVAVDGTTEGCMLSGIDPT